MRRRTLTLIAVMFTLLLMMHLEVVQALEAGAEPDILARIERSITWLEAHRSITPLGSYYSLDSGESALISVAENSAVAYILTMHTKLMPTRKYIPEILSILRFTLNAKAGAYFHLYYNVGEGAWISGPQPYYGNAEILQNIAFASFHLRLEDQLLLEDEKKLLDEAVESSEDLIDVLAETSRVSGGAWKLRYEDGSSQARLRENSMILVSLLHVAAYEEKWGSSERSRLYGEYAQETARWILKAQEKEPTRWGYGGFYETAEDSAQSTISNAVAVFSLTTYLRLISLIDEEPNPTIQEVREAVILWEEAFLRRMVDEHGGPYQGRDKTGVRKYPKELLAASMILRAMVETWVVHGDPKYRVWCITLYEWITGGNEAGVDLQLEDGSFSNGLSASGAPEGSADLYTSIYTVASLIYGEWINIPEAPLKAVPLLLTLILLVGFKLTSRVCPGRAPIDKQSLRRQPMTPGSPCESYIGNP